MIHRWLAFVALALVAQNSEAKPSLHELVQAGDLATIEQSIKPRRIDREDKIGNTALHYAAKAARADIVELLLTKGADVNAVNSKYGTLPLHELARTVLRDRRAIGAAAAVLLEHGAKYDVRDNHGATPLTAAARTGNRFIVKAILDHVEISSAERSESLALAREFGRLGVIRLLEDRGVESSEGREAGLLNAARIGDYAMTDSLLRSGAPLSTRGPSGETPLILSVLGKHTEVARLLIERGARVTDTDAEDRTALHFAAADGHRDLVDTLLDAGAEVNARSATHGTPLVSAAEQERVDMVQYLVERGARPADADATPELAFGSGLAWQVYADFRESEDPPALTAERRTRAKEQLNAAKTGFENELEEARRLRKRKERGELVTDVLAATIATAAVIAVEQAYQANMQANRRQLVQITALNDASSYADYHRRYEMYSRAMLKPNRPSPSFFRDPFHLNLTDHRVANKTSFPGIDVMISEYERRIALTDKLIK